MYICLSSRPTVNVHEKTSCRSRAWGAGSYGQTVVWPKKFVWPKIVWTKDCLGNRSLRQKSLGQKLFGQRVVWAKIVWPKGCLDNGVVWTKLGPRGGVQQGSISCLATINTRAWPGGSSVGGRPAGGRVGGGGHSGP